MAERKPFEIYRAPARRFPAAFVGTMNFLAADVRQGRVHAAGQPLPLAAGRDGTIDIAFRPAAILVRAASLRADTVGATQGRPRCAHDSPSP